jgi:hypothetical protein
LGTDPRGWTVTGKSQKFEMRKLMERELGRIAPALPTL